MSITQKSKRYTLNLLSFYELLYFQNEYELLQAVALQFREFSYFFYVLLSGC